MNLEEVRFVILTDVEFNDKYNRDSIEEAYNHAATSLEEALQHVGIEVNKASALDLLVSEEVFCKLGKYASQVLVLRGLPCCSTYEMRRFFAFKLLRSRFDVSTGKSWEEFIGPLATKYGFTMMSEERFKNILTCIRGYDVTSRSGDSGDDS